MTAVKSRPKLTAEQLRCGEQFAGRLKETFGDRVLAVVHYRWVIEDGPEEDEDEERYLEVVVVIQDYRSEEEEEKLFDISTALGMENGFDPMLFPEVYDAIHFREHALQPWWEPALVVEKGRVIYDSGFIADLRKQKAAIGGRNAE